MNITHKVWQLAGLLDRAKGPPEEVWETCYTDVLSLWFVFLFFYKLNEVIFANI